VAEGTFVVTSESLSYSPLEYLETNRQKKCVFTLNGNALENIRDNAPEILKNVQSAILRGQVEIVTEGYAQPIFTLIPEIDGRLQIQKAVNVVQEILGVLPRGIWFPRETFSPGLIPMLASVGVEYAIVDPVLKPNGVRSTASQLDYYVTEEEGIRFPIFFFQPIHWEEMTVRSGGSFFEDTPTTYMESHASLDRIYFPNSKNERAELINDARTDLLHKKIIWVSGKVAAVAKPPLVGSLGDDRLKKLSIARDALFMGESARGFISPSSSFSTQYGALLRAEKIADDLKHSGTSYLDVSVTDFDFDGSDEVAVATPFVSLGISPKRGGKLFECSYRPKNKNVIQPGVEEMASSLGDLILYPNATRDLYMGGDPGILRDFRNTESGFFISRKTDCTQIILDAKGGSARIRKAITFFPNVPQIEIAYNVIWEGNAPVSALFGTEWSFVKGDVVNGSALSLNTIQRIFTLIDAKEDFHLSFTFTAPARVWELQDEGRFVFHWPISLSAGESFEVGWKMSFEEGK